MSNTFSYRNTKRLDAQKFVDDLSKAPWDTAFVFEDTEDIVGSWYKIFTDILDSHIPVKEKRVKKSAQPIWFTSEINEAMKKRDKLLKKARISESSADWATFKCAKNEVCNSIRNAKEKYFKNQFTEHKNNPKRLWSLIKNLTREDVNNHAPIRQLKEEAKFLTDTLDIAECLNHWFVKQPIELLRNLPSHSSSWALPKHIKDLTANSVNIPQLTIPHITPKNIEELLKLMPSHKAAGSDGLGARILKIAAPAISLSLSRLINHCIDMGTFPSAWKTAKVTPIYKGQGSKDDKNNYLPISVLPLLSKIFEKHVHQALYSYMRKNNLLYTLQSGFRRSYSTETALIRLTDQLLSDVDNDQVSGLVFVDYKKAFDLIDHDILLTKLETYGITSRELMLLTSYLKGRRSSVAIGGVQSEYRLITHGVPQGSVLGPLLFIIFVNDLPNSVSQSTVDIYADDTTLSTSAVVSDLPAIQQRLQDDINKIADWTSYNKMVLNASKTKSLLVTGKRLEKKAPDTKFKLSCKDSEIEQKTSYKLLGVKLDNHLSFTEHIDDICKKMSQRIAVLKKIKRNLPLAERKLYFNALIKPIMLYGSCAWCTASEENVNRVSKLQKRAARVILDAHIDERSELLFKRLDWLPLKEELKLKRASLIFRRIKDENNCPSYITKLLTRNSDRHTRTSRYGKYNLVCPSYNRETEGGRTFQANGAKLWNSIPLDIRKKDSIGSFRSSFKKYLLAKNS